MFGEIIVYVPIVFESFVKLIKLFLFFICQILQNVFSRVLLIRMQYISIPGPFLELLKFIKIIKDLQDFHCVDNSDSFHAICIVASQQQSKNDKLFSIHFQFLKDFMGREVLNVIVENTSKDISGSKQKNVRILCYDAVDQILFLKVGALSLSFRNCLDVWNANHLKQFLKFDVSLIL
jgi:hypothetical protein